MRPSQDRFRELLLLTGLCGFFFFFRLSGFGLLGPDEPRYAQVAREMLAGHNWVTPILYGHRWLEKPILLYWGEMVSYVVFGVSDWAARVPSAVAASGFVFGTFVMVRRIRPEAGLDAALAVGSSVLVLGFARAAATDMLLAAPFGLSLLAWFCWYQSRDRGDGGRRWFEPWLVLFYALSAVGMLAKGPVAPGLAALVVIVFCAVNERKWEALWRTLDPLGIAVFLAIAAPWYVLVQLRNPEFFHEFFLQQNLSRFGSNLYRHRQPFWYYVPVALAATLPWTVWVIQGLADAARMLRLRMRGAEAPATSEAKEEAGFEIFLAVWALVPIIFFSLSHSKLPGYILPAVPALVILAAVTVHRRAAEGRRPGWMAIGAHGALLAAFAAALCLAPHLALKLRLSATELMIAGLAGTAVLLVVVLPLLIAGWPSWRFVTLLPLILGVGVVLRGFAPALDATQSSRPVAEALRQIEVQVDPTNSLPVTTFALNRNMAFGLSFYLDRVVAPYEGLEVSPTGYQIPAAVPASEHILITREGSLPGLGLLLSNRRLQRLGSYRPQRLEIYEVSPAP